MAKNIQFNKSITHNVYLLYFLFIATLLHLGYFVYAQENILLASFSLAVLFLYLLNPNMVIVLGISLIFVDLLYLVQTVPEGFDSSGNSRKRYDASGNLIKEYDASGNLIEPFDFSENLREGFDPSGNRKDSSGNEGFESSGLESSGVDISGTRIREKFTDSEGNPLTITNLFNKVKEIQETDEEDLKGNLNTSVGTKGLVKERGTGNSINEVNKQNANVKNLINTVKELSPDLNESLKSINSIDINELNKLINNLNNMSKGIQKNGV